MTALRSIAFLFLFGLVIPAAAHPQEQPDDADLVHPGDLIDVDVVGSFEFDWRGTLNPEGFLNGLDKSETPIYGLCKSESEIAEAVTRAYSKFLREPTVVVRVLDRSNRPLAYLDGAVRSPSRFRIKRNVHLRELIVLAGGLTDKASGAITLYRPADLNCRKRAAGDSSEKGDTVTIKIADLLAGSPEADRLVHSGDIVNVLESLPIYVIGGVNTPKQISSRTQTTLSRAVAAAGGVSKRGMENRVVIYRREGGETRVLQFDLEKIGAGTIKDPPLKAFDIVEVAEKGGERRKFPPVVEASDRNRNPDRLPLKIVE